MQALSDKRQPQPIGGVTTAFIVLFFQAPKREVNTLSLRQKLNELDFLGTLAFLPAIICLLIGLQWGGTRYPWSSAKVVVLLVFAGVFMVIFIIIQIWKQDKATVPPRIIKQRSMAFGAWFSFWIGAAYFLLIYYVSRLFRLISRFRALRKGQYWECSADTRHSYRSGSNLSKASPPPNPAS